MQLTERYRPRRIRDFAGLSRAKAVMTHFAKAPYPAAFCYMGAAGTGKTSLALAVAEEIKAQVIHVPAGECTVDKVRWLRDVTACVPMFGAWHCVIIDECDRMTPQAQVAMLSLLDATGFPENTVFILTCNTTKGLETRFMSRCRTIEFDGGAESQEIANYLTGIWYRETGGQLPPFRMREFIETNGGNIRGALMGIELELICQQGVAA
jgi:replication-associated recombination protein RarA